MNTGPAGGAGFLGIGLRWKGTLSISSDRLVSAGVTYSVADIAWAGLVNDPAAPAGVQPMPALAWRMTDGQYMSATPAHPEEAWQVLEELFKYRPDLRTPLPPLPPPPPPNERYPLAYGSHGASAPNESAQPDQNQTVMAGIAHLCNFFGGPILAYILWKINRKTAPNAAEQSRKAFYFQIVVTLALAVVGAIAFNQPISDEASATSVTGFVLWSALFVAVYIYAALFSVIGAVKAFHGQPFHYPLMGGI